MGFGVRDSGFGEPDGCHRDQYIHSIRYALQFGDWALGFGAYYPMVVIVTMHHHPAAMIESNCRRVESLGFRVGGLGFEDWGLGFWG